MHDDRTPSTRCRSTFRRASAPSAATAAALLFAVAPAPAQQLELASVDPGGLQVDSFVQMVAISGDGDIVAFVTASGVFDLGDQNRSLDVYLKVRSTGAIEPASVSSGGSFGNRSALLPSLSNDGRYVTFESDSVNLVTGDANGRKPDIFVRDRQTSTTTLVSLSSAGVQGNDASYAPKLSSDGRYVLFHSKADNLVAGDTNGVWDIFIRDRNAGSTTRVSHAPGGAEVDGHCLQPSLSADGSVIAWESAATNLSPLDPNSHHDIDLLDRPTATTTLVSSACDGTVSNAHCNWSALSESGQVVAFFYGASNLDPDDGYGGIDDFSADFTGCPIATWTTYGSGWPGTNGIPSSSLSADPDLGASLALDAGNPLGAATIGVLLVGSSRASAPTGFGGTLLVAPFTTPSVAIPAAGLSLPETIPCDCALPGLLLDVQLLLLDPGASKGVAFTPGLELVVGR